MIHRLLRLIANCPRHKQRSPVAGWGPLVVSRLGRIGDRLDLPLGPAAGTGPFDDSASSVDVVAVGIFSAKAVAPASTIAAAGSPPKRKSLIQAPIGASDQTTSRLGRRARKVTGYRGRRDGVELAPM